jgi:hypothetical protein
MPRAPRWSLTLDCAFAATGLDGAIGVRGGGALYSRIGVLAWYGPGFLGMAFGTPRGMVLELSSPGMLMQKIFWSQACERAELRSLDLSYAALPTSFPSHSLQPGRLNQNIRIISLYCSCTEVLCILMANDVPPHGCRSDILQPLLFIAG